MNRPNRRPPANLAVVVQAQKSPAREKAGKLPEWATATAIVTVATIFAFSASSFLVVAFATEISSPLAIYFSITDYVKITPLWAVPALVSGLVWLLPFAMTQLGLLGGSFTLDVFDLVPYLLKRISVRVPFYRYIAVICLATFIFLTVPFCLSFFLSGIWQVFSISAFGAAITFLVLSFTPGSGGIKLALLALVWCATFAYFSGLLLKPYELISMPLTRVRFESAKDKVASAEGKVIFDLDRYLLLHVETRLPFPGQERPNKEYYNWPHSVVAIPHEKIKSIETPPLVEEQEKKLGGQ